MIICFALLLLENADHSVFRSTATDPTAWATALSKSVLRQQTAESALKSRGGQGTVPPGVKISTSDSTAYTFDGTKIRPMTEDELREFNARTMERFGKVSRAQSLARKLELTDARALVSQAICDGSLDKTSSEVLAEIYLLEDRYGSALLALAPTPNDTKEEFVLLMGAYAAAMDGQVFAGQSEYCSSVAFRFSDGLASVPTLGARAYATTTDKSAATLALASWYEVHNFDECAKHYYGRALELDPVDAWASYRLGAILLRQHHAVEAVQYLERAASHSDGRLQRSARRELMEAKGRAAAGSLNVGGGH